MATAVLALSNFGFHIEISHLLGVGQYAGLGALLSLLLLMTVPLGAIQLACIGSQRARPGDRALGQLVGRLTGVSAIAASLCVLVAPSISTYLHLRSAPAAALLAPWLIVATADAALEGVLIGRLQYKAVALSLIFGNGLTRLGLGYLISSNSGGLAGAMVATVVGQAVATGILLVAVRTDLFAAPTSGRLRINAADGAWSLGALSGFTVLTGVDTVLARHLLGDVSAGDYVAAATAGKIALFLPSALATAAFPRFVSSAPDDHAEIRSLLWKTVLGVLALGAAAALVLSTMAGLVIRILFGRGYEGAATLLAPLAVAGAGLALVNVTTYYLLAQRRLASMLAWPAAVGVGVLFYCLASGPKSFAWAEVGCVLTLAVSQFGLCLRVRTGASRRPIGNRRGQRAQKSPLIVGVGDARPSQE